MASWLLVTLRGCREEGTAAGGIGGYRLGSGMRWVAGWGWGSMHSGIRMAGISWGFETFSPVKSKKTIIRQSINKGY